MKKFNIKVEGISPLLINRFIDTQIDTKAKKRTGGANEIQPENKLYISNGKSYIPSVYFRNCLIDAGKQFKITGSKGKSTYSKLIASTINIEPGIIFISPDKWTAFRISAVNPMTKGRMMVTRPKFDKWSCEFEAVLNDDSINWATLKEMFDYGGRYVGIGDWRPDKKGMFGKFIVTSFQEVK